MSNEEKEIEQSEELMETVIPGLSIEEYNRIRNKALEEAKTMRHAWVMKGPYLICNSCTYPHRAYIGNSWTMTGIDQNGNPILKPKVLQTH